MWARTHDAEHRARGAAAMTTARFLVSVVIVLCVSHIRALRTVSTVTQAVNMAMIKTATAKGSMMRYEKR